MPMKARSIYFVLSVIEDVCCDLFIDLLLVLKRHVTTECIVVLLKSLTQFISVCFKRGHEHKIKIKHKSVNIAK